MSRSDYPYAHPPRLPEGEHVELPALLAGTGPIEIEIGPGRGAFILERAEAVAELRMLGIEIRRKWATLVNQRLIERGFGARAQVVCEDAREALGRLGPDRCVDRVFVHFPDPWWKKRHTKRLVVIDPLIVEIGRLLRDGGELFVQTDVRERCDQYAERLAGHSFLRALGDVEGSARLANNPYAGRSNRERRADQDGLPVHRLRYQRVASAAAETADNPSL